MIDTGASVVSVNRYSRDDDASKRREAVILRTHVRQNVYLEGDGFLAPSRVTGLSSGVTVFREIS